VTPDVPPKLQFPELSALNNLVAPEYTQPLVLFSANPITVKLASATLIVHDVVVLSGKRPAIKYHVVGAPALHAYTFRDVTVGSELIGQLETTICSFVSTV
jgi:hypothetical protein